MITGLDSVMVFTRDITKSIAFYRDTLSLPLRMQHGDFAVFGLPNGSLAVHGGVAADADTPPDHATSPVLGVEDYAEAKAKLESRGCEFVFENSTDHAIFGTFKDPDGNSVQIIERRV